MEVDIEAVDVSGDGLAYVRGTRLFVPFTIPGERVRVQVLKRRGRDAWAALETIVRPSVHRVVPRCAHFGPPDRCGGCTWQHIAYPEQLRLKSRLVERLVRQVVKTGVPEVRDTRAATPLDRPWEYRQKVHFVFANAGRGGRLVMGHYVRGSRRVFAARECPVHAPRGNAFAFALVEACARAGVSAAPAGTLRHLAVRVGKASSETMATLVVTDTSDRRLRAATRGALQRAEAPDAFFLNVHAGSGPFIFGKETRHVSGPHRLREQVAGTSYALSPTAFFQTNVQAAELLVQLVLEALPAGRPVLDLYAGGGLFALPLARRGDPVLAVEENRSSTDDGIASLHVNGISPDRCRFVARRVETTLRTLHPSVAEHVVLDPPRDGCDHAVLEEVFGRLAPRRVAYVSCNPEALAVDLGVVTRLGYRIESLQPVDMFPHTPHIETVAVLAR